MIEFMSLENSRVESVVDAFEAIFAKTEKPVSAREVGDVAGMKSPQTTWNNQHTLRAAAIRIAEAVSQEEHGDRTRAPWSTHEARFMRIAYHLCARARRLATTYSRRKSTGLFLGDAGRFGVSPVATYGKRAKTANWPANTKLSSKTYVRPKTAKAISTKRSANAKPGNAKTKRKPTLALLDHERYGAQAQEQATILAGLREQIKPTDTEVANLQERLS